MIRHETARLLRALTTSVLLVSTAAWADEPCDSGPNPCFSKVSDYLSGQHLLLPEDDLIFFHRYSNTQSPSSLVTWVSENTKFPTTEKRSIENTGCSIARGPVRARLFNTLNDWVVSLQGRGVDRDYCGSAGGGNIALYWADPSSQKPPAGGGVRFNFLSEAQIFAADVNGDGYDDIIISDRETLLILTAVDPENPAKGLTIAGQVALPTVGPVYPFSRAHGKIAVGDFNGDGAIDLVVPVLQQPMAYSPWGDWKLFVISVCPAAGFKLFSNSSNPGSKITCKAPFEVHARPLSSAYDVGDLKGADATIFGPGSKVTGYNAGIPPRVVAGHFLGRGGPPQLFLESIESHVSWSSKYQLVIDVYRRVYRLFSFDADLLPTKVSESLQDYPQSPIVQPVSGFDYNRYNDILLKGNLAGRLGMYSDRDWVILGGPDYNSGGGLSGYSFFVKVFDHNGKQISNNGASAPNIETGFPIAPVYGMVVGRFDTKEQNGDVSFRQQIAILFKQHGVTGWTRALWSVQPDLKIMSPAVDRGVTEVDISTLKHPGFDPEQGGLFSADTQGRSLLLGAPVKGVMEGHFQPDVVLSIPPMHIDYIRDASGQGPEIINFTVIPSGRSEPKPFNTEYAFTSSGTNKGEYSHVIDTSTSIQTTLEGKVVWGDEENTNTSASLKVAAKGGVETNYNTQHATYQTKTVSMDATTGFADHLFFSLSRQNFWYYPLLGKRCPATNPNCSANEKQQQAIIISGPDKTESQDADVTYLEWYQPVNEPGNVFSYPWDLDQMKLVSPDLNALTNESWSLTDTSTKSVRTDWKQGGESGETNGTVGKWEADVSGSIGFQFGLAKVGTVGAKLTVDVSHSGAVKTVNTNTVVLDASTGIISNKPGFRSDVANKYYYYFASYIFGKNPLGPSLIEPELKQKNGQPVTQQFFGPLTVAYAADPFHSTGVAPWWRHAYTRPDIGLNHPARWNWDPDTQTATFNKPTKPPNPKSILTDPFYYMKGLYTFEASDDPNAPVQLASATAGDLLTLQARVYNFSVVDMPAGTSAHARFYGQIYDPTNGILSGNAFLIGETSIGAIPGFKSASNRGTLPNWKLATTTFDTTKYGGKLLVFWVVVWGEDEGGNLVQEIEGHGLKENPAKLTFKQISDVPIEDYSNNIGIHNSHTPFFVRPKTAVAATTLSAAGDVTALHSGDIEVNATPVPSPGKRSYVTITVHNTSGGDLSFEPVAIYEGDPDSGGKLIDYQEIPYVEKGGDYTLRSAVSGEFAGMLNLFVRVGREGNSAQGYGTASLNVP